MKDLRRLRRLTIGFITLVGSLAAAAPTEAQLKAAAGCSACFLTNLAQLRFEELPDVVWHAKLYANDLRMVYTVAVLEDGETVVDPAVYLENDRQAVQALRGPISRDLADRIAPLGAMDLVPVQILVSATWHNHNRELLDNNPSLITEWEQIITADRLAQATPVVDWLDSHRFTLTDGVEFGPALRSVLPKAALLELALEPYVMQLDYDAGELQCSDLTTWGSAVSLQAAMDVVASYPPPSSLSICVDEYGIPHDFTYLEIDAVYSPPGGTPGTPGLHSMHSVGFLRNTFGTGAAQFALIKLMNSETFMPTSTMPSRDRWCASPLIGQPASILSRPLADVRTIPMRPTVIDMLEDYLQVIPPFMTVVKPSGNGGASVQNRSAMVIVVGGTDVNGTGSPVDDFVAPGSAWANPITPHNDRELPLVVAPGYSQVQDGIIGDAPEGSVLRRDRGTSWSSPIVAGIVAQLQAVNKPGYLNWPEASRATLVASSHQQMEAKSGRLPAPDATDGFGLVNAESAVRIAENRVSASGTPTASGFDRRRLLFAQDFDANGASTMYYEARAPSEGRLRVAFAFESLARCDRMQCLADAPVADLDLVVQQVGGSRKCVSSSFDSLVEYCDLAVKADTVYRIGFRLGKGEGGTPKFPSGHSAVAWDFVESR